MPIARRIAVVACALALVPASLAEAKAPPKGKYDCTIGGTTLFGALTIKGKGRYTRNGKTGRFKTGRRKVAFRDGFAGWRMSFKGGSFGRMKGRWYKAKDGTPEGTYEIALKNPLDGFESIYCDKRK